MDNYLGKNDERIRCRGILHIVKKGDTLYKIAKHHGVPLSRVMYANPYVDVYNLQVGDEICVPVMAPRPPMMGHCPDGNHPSMPENRPVGNRPGGICPPMAGNCTRTMRQPMIENNVENNMENNPDDMASPVTENRGNGAVQPERENWMDEIPVPTLENRTGDRTFPMQENRLEDGTFPMQENSRGETGSPMPRNCPEHSCSKVFEEQNDSRSSMPWINTSQDEGQMMDEYLMKRPLRP